MADNWSSYMCWCNHPRNTHRFVHESRCWSYREGKACMEILKREREFVPVVCKLSVKAATVSSLTFSRRHSHRLKFPIIRLGRFHQFLTKNERPWSFSSWKADVCKIYQAIFGDLKNVMIVGSLRKLPPRDRTNLFHHCIVLVYSLASFPQSKLCQVHNKSNFWGTTTKKRETIFI